MEVAFIAKTNLNTDGRILNQLRILEKNVPTLKINFILFPDKETKISLPSNVKLSEINITLRNSKLLRPFTVLYFTLLAVKMLIKLKPRIIHVQDSSVVLPVFIYKSFFGRSVKIIYDDHELPNENQSIFEKLITSIENRVIKISEFVIFANKERMQFLNNKLLLNYVKTDYFLNLPYFTDELLPSELSNQEYEHYNNILKFKTAGKRIVIHQGPINESRGSNLVIDLISRIEKDIIVVFIGGKLDTFKEIFGADIFHDRCYFVGTVPYMHLDLFWQLGDASIVLYDPKYINNKLCAPNRYFISLFKNIPIIVNKSNPVLFELNTVFKSGLYAEDIIIGSTQFSNIFGIQIDKTQIEDLRQIQISRFSEIYLKFKNEIHS